eukprot:6712678-Pyramimonas_sp.AAC.1
MDILTTDQSDAGRTGIFSRWTNRTAAFCLRTEGVSEEGALQAEQDARALGGAGGLPFELPEQPLLAHAVAHGPCAQLGALAGGAVHL